MSTYRILHGECSDVLPTLAAESADAVICDPPYGIRFMGKAWDGADIEAQVARRAAQKQPPAKNGQERARPRQGRAEAAGTYDQSPTAHRAFQEWCEVWAAEALRVAKPGARLLAFGGTRTFHRLTCGIQDAGWEIEDCLSWLYGSGFPKHKSKLKPAWEPVILARRPAPRVSLLNIDGCRIGTEPITTFRPVAVDDGKVYGKFNGGDDTTHAGRWPANVVLDEEAADALDAQTGTLHSGDSHVLRRGGTTGKGMGYGSSSAGDVLGVLYGDSGGASRFFYTAKAPRSEREAGLSDAPQKPGGSVRHGQSSIGSKGGRDAPRSNHHPTVKPLDLMRWLVRLVTPPGGLVLDPFCGSGTTGCAALMEGMSFIGIEREAEYVAIAERRLAHWGQQLAMPLSGAAS